MELDEIIAAFGAEIKRVNLGFSPLKKEGWEVSELKEEDTTLFVKGRIFEEMEEKAVRFPALSHA